MDVREVRIGGAVFGGGPLAVIAGPCVIESEALAIEVAEALRDMTRTLGLPYVFKASYDKANRSSAEGFRGPGLAEGLAVLKRVRERVGVPVLSDVHAVEQVGPAAAALDAIQIPAFLCRQTDLLLAAARSGKPVNVKKGQFLAPWDMRNVVAKVESAGCRDILLTERGSTFGYNNLVVDMRGIPTMRETGYPVVFDATHSVQLPGGLGTASGGQRELVSTLARAAVAAGADALFLEVHPRPDEALCDGPTMVPLSQVQGLLETCERLRTALR
jgi:2-dehydro-3-deoxyphosphooctonate aldolase (KDO 8-P synthase)